MFSGHWTVLGNTRHKTDVGKVYITADNNSRGPWCKDTSCKLNFYGGEYEGRNASVPCAGTLIRVDAGNVAFFGPWIAYGMSAPAATEHGLIEVAGGNVLIDRPCYGRGNTAETVPLDNVSGGRAEVRSAAGSGTWVGVPRVRRAAGVLERRVRHRRLTPMVTTPRLITVMNEYAFLRIPT